MSSPLVNGFRFDEENEDEISAHGLSINQVQQILGNFSVILRNRKQRRALYLMIGRDNGGSCISVPIEPTNEKGLWRPVTAWYSKSSEVTILKKVER